jgi:hypothetical protein
MRRNNQRTINKMAEALKPDRPLAVGQGLEPNVVMRIAKVTAVTAPTVSIQLGGSTTTLTTIKCLVSYASPTVNDNVIVAVLNGTSMIVLGKIA